MSTGSVVSTLTRLIVIKSNYFSDKGYASFKKEGGSVLIGETSVFSPYVKIEAERATSDSRYINLRFCYSNKYWQKNAGDKFIVAVSNKPEEDTTKSSCTLFEAVTVDSDKKLFYLRHVQSGGRLLIDPTTMAFFVEQNPRDVQGYLSYIDWDSIVKLPQNIALKGYNGSWLGGILSNKVNYLQFSVDDPNTPITTYKIELARDGHVRIFSNYFNKYCRRIDENWIVEEVLEGVGMWAIPIEQKTKGNPDWIVADSDDKSGDDPNTLFWPVKLDETTIALRNAGNERFCIGLDTEGKTRCLNASVPNITSRARLVVQELVMSRKIYNVRYRMEDSRIFNEKPFLAGTTTSTNNGDTPTTVAVSITYEDEKSYTFSHSISLTAGITTTFQAGVPIIGDASIEVNFEIENTMEWEETRSSKTSVTATGTVTVPAKSVATISYVGTRGTCDVPFTYTQRDKSSITGANIETDHIDGVFRGVNAYNFSFVVAKAHPI